MDYTYTYTYTYIYRLGYFWTLISKFIPTLTYITVYFDFDALVLNEKTNYGTFIQAQNERSPHSRKTQLLRHLSTHRPQRSNQKKKPKRVKSKQNFSYLKYCALFLVFQK